MPQLGTLSFVYFPVHQYASKNLFHKIYLPFVKSIYFGRVVFFKWNFNVIWTLINLISII